ncbi:hypothetical protein CONPUDRAFT_159394 [Coniophora puteana RWD-64-598 SS2]|uniref:Uncharacterized protein n=1 Tax=Coniophora puteana (strain RWD-64-598) TaxID=741705 RepID=A0A5M3M8K3_CONPW|nr:uncharacterized protein CONPUDRAFT_159394 [Coniophora puteana RWD-64-598 SS2]EIW75266.1 hypothetical protein CONPUDRAFT_159394 [Coniophora puteana RWD-64-598 SS2]
MSTAFVVGLFSLVNGDRRAEQSGSTQTFYCFYETAFRYSNGSEASSAQIRVYSPLGGLTLPDDTLAFVVAKACFDREGPILLDAQPQQFFPFPGDPSEEAYYDHVPEFDFPLLFAVGRVNAPSTIDSLLPPLQRFDIAVSEYVRNTVQHSKAEMVFNNSTSRWAHTPTPAVNSSVGVLGMSAAKTSDGYIQFELLSLALNVSNNVSIGGSGSLAARTVTVTPTADTQSKRDRFSARASVTKGATANGTLGVEPGKHSHGKKKASTEDADVGGGPQDRIALAVAEGLRVLPDMANYVDLWPLPLYIELNVFDNVRHMQERRHKRTSRRSRRVLSISRASHSRAAEFSVVSVDPSPSISTTATMSSSQGADSSTGTAVDQQLAIFLRTDCAVPVMKTADALAALGIPDMQTFNTAIRNDNGEAFEEFIQKNGAFHGLTLWEMFSLVRGAKKFCNSK